MALQYQLDKEKFDALEEGQQALYRETDDGYVLDVEGIDDGKELKEALRKEREERAEAKRKLKEFETDAERKERERLEKQQEWEQLSKKDRERADGLEKQLSELKDKVANGERTAAAEGIVAGLIDREAAGGVQLLSGFADNDVIVIGYAAAAIAEADKRTRIDFGVETEKVMRLKIRGLSAQGTPFIFELNRWNGTPSGIDLIGGDDFSGQDLTGTLAAVGGKIGTWQKLSV